jgi:protein SCO1/2
MSHFRRLLIFLLLTLSLTAQASTDALRVVATIKPIHSLLAGLMEGGEAPVLLLQGKSTPYGYQLSEEQRRTLAEADLVVWVGPELDGFVKDALGEGTRSIELLENPRLKVLPHRTDDTLRDPYFWLDSRNAIILVNDLTRVLIEMDPGRSHLYTRNRERFMRGLTRLDRALEYGYKALKTGIGYLYHDTQQYFEQAYAMKVAAVLADASGEHADAATLLKARLGLQSGEVSCILAERGLPAPHLSMLTTGNAVRVGKLDSLGVGFEPGPKLYEQLMWHNTKVIKECMGIKGGSGSGTHTLLDSAEEELPDELGGRFILLDHNNEVFTDRDLLGKYQLLYFGYTFCPDVCPTSLTLMSQALEKLDEQTASRIQPYFITLDPQRDTPAVLRDYVKYFYPGIIGLTGNEAMIQRVARQYHIQYEKVVEEGGDPDAYQLDHSAGLTLMSPDGRFLARFAHGMPADKLAERLRELVR